MPIIVISFQMCTKSQQKMDAENRKRPKICAEMDVVLFILDQIHI